MKTFPGLLILLAAALPAARADIPPDWSTNAALVASVPDSNRPPVLAFFTASWCGPCKLMTRTTLADPAVMQVLAGVDHVAVDIDEHADLARDYSVDAVPTFLLLSAAGEADRATGYRPPGDFLDWLTNGLARARDDTARRAAATRELAAVDELLAAAGTNSAREAAGKLFDLCAGRDNALVQAAGGRLKKLAARDPAAVIEGLGDARLACRIQSANALHAIIGDAFDVDPWSDSAALHDAMAVWRGKLAQSPAATPELENKAR